MLTRRSTFKAAAGVAAAAALGAPHAAEAADKILKIGNDNSFTGADSQGAVRIANAVHMAFEEANAGKAVPGYKFVVENFDDATATAGQYDPAQGAINARKMVSDKLMVAAIGPSMSGVGKAMSPILSMGDLAIITPASTNPDITDPKFARQYRPKGKAIYFRTVTTDAYQGPNMANYMVDVLKVKSIYILDDSGAYGVGMADAFEAQAKKKGCNVLGRDRLDPKAADYSAALTKIKQLNPDALYYGGVGQAGTKLAKQAYDIIPKVIKAGGDGMVSADVLQGAGFPAVEGWYATQASPHIAGSHDPKVVEFTKRYHDKYNMYPDDYSITAYDAALAIIASAKRINAEGRPVTRSAIRDMLEKIEVPTLQGLVSFDANGDIKDHTVSVFQIQKDGNFELNDPAHQYVYKGVAPQS
ncbi:MAG: branched-chain amino acid ABC transporter substrate-binding protein [Acetobacteraceae bacterium]|nr:branched-chain amino acid ABC transporter substrate-binding protein [Acetobacteraceae bacterium]